MVGAILLNLNTANPVDAIINNMNAILRKHGVSHVITNHDVTVTENTVSDFAKPESRLSECIIESLWPSIKKATVYHFTSREAAESIIATKTLRLQNIAKRYGEGELVTFCSSHKLSGYLQRDAGGHYMYRTLLMPNMFYASFTDAGDREQEVLWRTFAPNDGVRLAFEVEALNPNFRKIRYETTAGSPIPLLAELATSLSSQYSRRFILSGISRLCAFYLSESDYGQEKELRMLYKTCEGVGLQPVGTGASSYVDLPLDVMTEAGYKLNIVEACSNTRPNMPDSIKFLQRESCPPV